MQITNLAHASYRVSDREASLRFYRDILGLKEKFTIRYDEEVSFIEAGSGENSEEEHEKTDPAQNEENKEGMRAFLDSMRSQGSRVWITYLEVAPHQYVELFSSEGGEENITFDTDHFNHIGYLHLALEVDDIHSAYEEMKQKGVTLLSEPSMGIEHTWQFWILDPDGNAIELMQYTDQSWQLTGR